MNQFNNEEEECRFEGIYAAIEAIFVRCFSVSHMKIALERLQEYVSYKERSMRR